MEDAESSAGWGGGFPEPCGNLGENPSIGADTGMYQKRGKHTLNTSRAGPLSNCKVGRTWKKERKKERVNESGVFDH